MREDVDLGQLDAIWRLGGASYLPLRLILVAKLIDRYLDGLLADKADLSISQWRVVAQLAMLKQGTVRRMARQACVDPAEVSRAAALLERRGLVRRQENALDRRSATFSLTPAGEEHYLRFHPYWVRFSETLVRRIEATDRSAMEHGLTRIARELLSLLGQGNVQEPRAR